MGQQLREILGLCCAPGVGPLTFKKLVADHGDARTVLSRRPDADRLLERADRQIRLAAEHGVSLVTVFDEAYPFHLKQIYAPPVVLYVKGVLAAESYPKIAVVGSRDASYYGLKMARALSKDLASARVAVVSGMAIGIDSAAHEGALEGGGPTFAVLGGGLLSVRSVRNKKMAERIALNGAVISEYAMEVSPLPQYFPARNRIISGLSRGVLVVEAKRKSGALITVDAALAEGRDVFVVPGNADSARSEGTNALIKQGAYPVTSARDILQALGLEAPAAKISKKPAPLAPDEAKIYSLLDSRPAHVDDLIDQSRLSAPQAITALSVLEIKGYAKQLPGKNYVSAL